MPLRRPALVAALLLMLCVPLAGQAVETGEPAPAVTPDRSAETLIPQLNALSAAGAYPAMLDLLATRSGADDPVLLNYLGYALRKTGRPEQAVVAYRKALALDPDLHEARAYLGQGLIDMGDVEGAKAQLLEIRARGGRDTLAYATLKNAILDKTGY